MPNIAQVLREEIIRLARRQVKRDVLAVKKENVRMKRAMAELRRQVAQVVRLGADLGRKVAPVIAARQAQDSAGCVRSFRATPARLKRLRLRLGVTQAQFGKLVGVSAQSVVTWENAGDRRLRLRKTTLAALASIQKIGRREARRRLQPAD